MNILLATSTFLLNGGGISSYAQEFMKTYGGKMRITLLTDEEYVGEYAGMEVCSVKKERRKNYAYCQTIIDFINTRDFDLVVNSNSLIITVLSPFIAVPVITISHFVKGHLAITAGYNSSYLSKIVSLSGYGKKYIEEKFRIRDKDKIAVIYNAVKSGEQHSNVQKEDKGSVTMVYPGGVALQKSPDVVCRALLLLLKTDYDFKFYWLGDLTMPIARVSWVKSINQFFKNDRRIVFKGLIKREEVLKIMEEADVFLLPSRGEGCPISLLESMQYGCVPVVSDAKHASVELVNDGKFGLVVKQGSYKDLFDVLCLILSNQFDLHAFSEKAQKYLNNNLSPKVWKERMEEVFEDAVKGKKEILSYTYWNYYKSLIGLDYLLFLEKIKSKLLSLRFYFSFNFFFLWKKMKGEC